MIFIGRVLVNYYITIRLDIATSLRAQENISLQLSALRKYARRQFTILLESPMIVHYRR